MRKLNFFKKISFKPQEYDLSRQLLGIKLEYKIQFDANIRDIFRNHYTDIQG